jgi:hypothetical protein
MASKPEDIDHSVVGAAALYINWLYTVTEQKNQNFPSVKY